VFAAQARRADIVERLLNAGAHIDGVDDYGLTACFAATFFQSVDVLAVLLAREPDIEIKDGLQWQTPLQHSLAFNDDCISLMLINAGASLRGVRGSLCRFASRSTAAIQAMLNCGVTLNQMRDPLLNYTQLHLIAATHEWSADLHAAASVSATLIWKRVLLEVKLVFTLQQPVDAKRFVISSMPVPTLAVPTKPG
jgi:hypothetical protein